MTSVQRAKIVSYPWSNIFDLVLDVQSYPKFVPHCREVRLLSRKVKEPGVTIIIYHRRLDPPSHQRRGS